MNGFKLVGQLSFIFTLKNNKQYLVDKKIYQSFTMIYGISHSLDFDSVTLF